ncbi:MAG TPA: alpha-E domain-containing protein, partial [Chloroflexota bacterium]|nr:alpha-E domain-containing protein [Chloroflexota bacterium]
MLSRVAEDVFWMSRYVERAVAVARLIDVTLSLELDAGIAGEAEDDADLWAPLLGPASMGGSLTRPMATSAEGSADGADSDGKPNPRDV